ncbi:hypothetical protein TNCV_2254601 [Trichonephila clavipes]|nr:hypothetical protein TNCV_2254601 [Trichonephila clavipes]
MGTPTARNAAPAGSEYAKTVQSSHCSCLKKKKLSLPGALDLLQNLLSESSDALTDDSSDEEKSQQIICRNFR